MSSTAPDLQGIVDALGALCMPDGLSDAELCAWVQQVEGIGRQVDVLRVRAAGEVADRSRRELGNDSLAQRHGEHSGGLLLEKLTGVASGEAARRIRLATETAPRMGLGGEPLPARFEFVSQALHSAEIGVDAALTIVRNLAAAGRRASVDELEAAEQKLVADAQVLSADLVGVKARAWRDALDPDGAEPRDRELRRRRSFVIGRERDGMTPFWGEADPLSASQLRTWLGERTAPDRQPRFLDLDDPAFDPTVAALEVPDTGIDDPRTREQRSFDVLMGLMLAGVRADSLTNTPRHTAANVMVVVKQSDLDCRTGTAWLSDVTEPISTSTVAAIACESGIQKVLLGVGGEILALGRRERDRKSVV